LRLFFEEANRADQAFCLALIDIDHLAKYNDRFGHEAGDMLLEKLSHLFQSSVGKGAIVSRSEEDEFFIAFISASLGGAKIRAERIRKDARRLTFEDSHGTSITPVTLTIGLALYPTHGSTLEEILSAAEYALLLGKSRGGDCVVPP